MRTMAYSCAEPRNTSPQGARLKPQVPAAGSGLNHLIEVQTNKEKLLELLSLSKVPPLCSEAS